MACLARAGECYGRSEKTAKNEILGSWPAANRNEKSRIYAVGNIDAVLTHNQNAQTSYGSRKFGMANAEIRKQDMSLAPLASIALAFGFLLISPQVYACRGLGMENTLFLRPFPICNLRRM
jgi:hypothetical protein